MESIPGLLKSLKIRDLCTVVRYIHKVVKMWMWMVQEFPKLGTSLTNKKKTFDSFSTFLLINFSGNILVKRLSKANIYVKNTLEENAVGLLLNIFLSP